MKWFRIVLVWFVYLDLIECLPMRGRWWFQKEKEGFTQTAQVINEQYFDQPLDHFNQATNTTWKQRYWVYDRYFIQTGPVFIMIGGEAEENPVWLVRGEMSDLAKKFNALCLLLEHRYYGKSQPTQNLSVENLAYLSSEQALADLASFRMFIHQSMNLTDSNRWVSFGGSYSGSLSAWFRLKYPHLVYAAVASSAPMLAIVNFTDYFVVVNQSLSSYNPKCPEMIKQADQKVQALIQTDAGRANLSEMFRTCDTVGQGLDAKNFFLSLAANLGGVVQYNKDNRASSSANLTIDFVCDIMLNEAFGDVLDRYAAVNSAALDTYEISCWDSSYDSYVSQMKMINWNESAAEGGRQWTYQSCVEFGFFQTSDDQENQPFGPEFSTEFYIQLCKDLFGSKFDENFIYKAVYDTNTNYGGYEFEASRVIFINGQIDPWHSLSFTSHAPNENTEVVYIPGTAHCADLYAASANDPPQLTAARAYIQGYLAGLLSR